MVTVNDFTKRSILDVAAVLDPPLGHSKKGYFAPFIDNGFNTIFYNATALCYHADSINDFIRKFPNPNNLIKAVQEDIRNEVFFLPSHVPMEYLIKS